VIVTGELAKSTNAPRLRWPDAGAALSVSVLADGLSEIDPVCGMSLCGEKVMDRVERAGRVFFFCGDRCRGQFEADPGRFGPRV
jgi:YHS domain-containing protein